MATTGHIGGLPFFTTSFMLPEDSTAEGGMKYTGTTDAFYEDGQVYYNPVSKKAYIYAKNANATALNDTDPHILVRLGSGPKWLVSVLQDVTAECAAILCMPCADIAASAYGWFQIYGNATIDYDTTYMTAEAWTAGAELCITAGKLTSQAVSASNLGLSTVVATGDVCAYAAAAGTTDDTTRTIELTGRLASMES